MSRIIVRNLPSKALEPEIRSYFGSRGQITDVKLFKKRDGSSRRFAFVGFRTDKEAEDAVKYFNMSFMSSSRLDVALAKSLGDQSLVDRKLELKRKRELRSNATEYNTAKRQPKVSEPKNERLEEFLNVMQQQSNTALWKNDSTDKSVNARQIVVEDEDDNDIVDLNSLPRENEKFADVEDQSDMENGADKANDSSSKNENVMDDEEEWIPATNDDKTKEEDREISDLDWLKMRQRRIMENGEKPKHPTEANGVTKEPGTSDTADVSRVEPTNRLFLRNLSYTVTQSELQLLFAEFGTLKQVHLPIDPKTDKVKGIAFVEFENVDDACKALEGLDGHSFQGRLLHIIYAAPQRGYQLDEFDIKQMPLKKQKALKRRMQASRQQFSWNSLYLNPNTVLEAAAKKLGITKSEMMDPSSSNMAVQQVLAESSILETVQQYFRSKGVDLSKFSQTSSSNLSDTIILVKNLPFSTSALEIQDMFAQHGEVVCTLMPPDGGVAIVQFKLASAGRQAFRKLAFRRIGDSILYLQKAPKGVLDKLDLTDNAVESDTASRDESKKISKVAVTSTDVLLPENIQNEVNETEPEVLTSVFVKNLSFSTTVTSLSKLFQPLPGFINAKINTKPDPRNGDKKLSMGYGFVEFRTRSQADVAIKTMQNQVLDGHNLQLRISSRGQETQETASKTKVATSSKIVIKNIPFETSKQDIVDLFGTFGQLRSVRVPRKFNRQTRGFAFAEFATPKEAEHALASLQGAHLLGRRLIMDYANADAEDPEAEIERMEAKVAQQMDAQEIHDRRLGGKQKGFDIEDKD